jgi:diguanylate cyclase (GGDEF)-like protein
MSLRARLLLLISLATLVPTILLGIRFIQDRAREIDSALVSLAMQASNIASDLDEKIQGTAQLHFGLERARDLDSPNRAGCSAFLSAVREEYPQYTGILTINPDGSLFCDSLLTNRDLDLNDREYFKKALVTKDSVTLQPVVGRLTGTSVLQIAHPAHSAAGQVKYVLLASFSLQKFAAHHNQRISSPMDILLVDKSGTVLVPPMGMNWTNPAGTSVAGTDVFRFADRHTAGRAEEIVGIDGSKQFWAAATTPAIRDAGLFVMAGISKDVLVGPANTRLYQDLTVLMAISLVLFAGVWGFAEVGIRRQVRRIAVMANKLGAGDLSTRISAPFPSGELGGLIADLNAAASSLQVQHIAVGDLNNKLRRMAHYDTLTELPNRAAFNERFAVTLEWAAAQNERFTILSVDLDRLKETNDVHGHAAGDALLHEAGRRLQAAAPGVFVARIGGDEFTLIVTEGAQPAAAAALAESLLTTFADDFVIEGKPVQIGLSIGGAVYPIHGTSAKTLMINADAALYRAKAEPQTLIRFFEPEMGIKLQERHDLQRDLRLAIDRGELQLHYQPQVRMTGEIVGFEALARWQCAKRGMVSPGTFIPIAEEYGLIGRLGEWALREACREAASWTQPLTVCVNVSPIQFHNGDLAGLVHMVLLESGLAPGRLELEITEGVLINDFSRAVSILCQLKSLGVQIALDDFGTGYSSLSYLHSFAFDKIKIDRAFISDLDQNRHSLAIVRAVIGLGHSLGVPVLAEGVETEKQRRFLTNEGCDQLQGYLIGRPLAIMNYDALIAGLTVFPASTMAAAS